jgi:hypothetical protein
MKKGISILILLSSLFMVGFAPVFSVQAGSNDRLAALDTSSADKPGEPVYLANQLGPECDTGVVYYQGKALVPRNGCDSWTSNLLERPFNKDGKNYIPELDLTDVQMGMDEYWFYWKIKRYPATSQTPPEVSLVIELDTDLDGRGDFAMTVQPAQVAGTGWQKEAGRLLEDQNNDIGGSKPIIPDNPVITGNGYDTVKKADLWVRTSNLGLTMEFALPATFFESDKINFGWWAWALTTSVEMDQFDLVDCTTPSELYGVDNTCMLIYGDRPKNEMVNQCFKTSQQTGGKGKAGACVQGPKPSADSCWIWMPADCKWQCFN